MIMNNDYIHICQTTREWDATDDVDETLFQNSLLSDEVEIPTNLVEGMCFATKRNLQFALAGWTIYNNVRYMPITSNQKNFIVICALHSQPARSCN